MQFRGFWQEVSCCFWEVHHRVSFFQYELCGVGEWGDGADKQGSQFERSSYHCRARGIDGGNWQFKERDLWRAVTLSVDVPRIRCRIVPRFLGGKAEVNGKVERMSIGPKVAALAVVLHEGRVLLVRRRNEPDAGLWGYPGGHVEFGETALDAAVRELHEETTVQATPTDYLTNIDVIAKNPIGEITHHFLLAAVLCQYQSGTPLAQDDVSGADWFDFEPVTGSRISMSDHVDSVLQLALHRMQLG